MLNWHLWDLKFGQPSIKNKRIFPVSGDFNFQEFSIDDVSFLTKAINHAITEVFPRTIKKVWSYFIT